MKRKSRNTGPPLVSAPTAADCELLKLLESQLLIYGQDRETLVVADLGTIRKWIKSAFQYIKSGNRPDIVYGITYDNELPKFCTEFEYPWF